jgi:hypothetical protein
LRQHAAHHLASPRIGEATVGSDVPRLVKAEAGVEAIEGGVEPIVAANHAVFESAQGARAQTWSWRNLAHATSLPSTA